MSLAGCAYGFDDDYSTTIREENKQLRAENERLKAELAEAKNPTRGVSKADIIRLVRGYRNDYNGSQIDPIICDLESIL